MSDTQKYRIKELTARQNLLIQQVRDLRAEITDLRFALRCALDGAVDGFESKNAIDTDQESGE